MSSRFSILPCMYSLPNPNPNRIIFASQFAATSLHGCILCLSSLSLTRRPFFPGCALPVYTAHVPIIPPV
ncbi:hypothetical protein XELAEV_18008049mg [Xenopus laevis]|uniref:Uncharacterized protein n=1 Tax=Xenopus laevis TaxID=8355 RepID=A0A974I5Y4_XENLA|nr:hypothetical protein XELAEV_18008049mg [Xenopus laevis]